MLIGGLWHGPTWTFVLWGLLHGVGLAVARAVAGLRRRFAIAKRNTSWSRAAGVIVTFHFVCFAWIFFRAESLDKAIAMLNRVPAFTMGTANLAMPVALIIALGFAAHSMPDRLLESAQKGFVRLPATVQACLLFALAVGLYSIASSDAVPFIYAQF
jgi:D-alanyl-lipoteichoic acid acyltransferase DltB (MBOAT superfamily)